MKIFHYVFDGCDGTAGVTTDNYGVVLDGTKVFSRAIGKNINDYFRIWKRDTGRLPVFHHATRNEYGHYFVNGQLCAPLGKEQEQIYVEKTCK